MEILATFDNTPFWKIPECYIQTRWTRDCKKVDGAISMQLGSSGQTDKELFQQMCSIVVAQIPPICKHKVGYDVLLTHFLEGVKQAKLAIAASEVNVEDAPSPIENDNGMCLCF